MFFFTLAMGVLFIAKPAARTLEAPWSDSTLPDTEHGASRAI